MSNLDKFRECVRQGPWDALLLTSQVNRRYAAEYDIAEGMALITAEDAYYFTDSRYFEDAEKYLPDFSVQLVDREHPYSARILAVTSVGMSVLGFEEAYMTVAEYRALSKKVPVQWKPAQTEISSFRIVKTDAEFAAMRKAQQITDQTFSELLNIIRVGMTEMEIKTELLYQLYRNGSEGPSFDPIVISGAKTSVPHGVSGQKKLEPGDFVTMDFGCKYNGYCSDMTRTVAMGYATEEMQKVYQTVLDAQAAALSISKAGLTGKVIDAAARDVIVAAGYGAYFGHSYGHGLGLEVHEAPNCAPSWDRALPEGCVCSAEPGIYLPGKFGVRIEDVVRMTASGCDNLTESPKNLLIL